MRRYQQGARKLSIPEFKPNFPAISFRYVAFSADGARFVSNSSGLPISTNARTPDQRVVDWTVRDATSGEQVASLGFPEGEGLRPSLSADGSRLAISVQTPNDKTNVKYEHLIIVVETATGRRLVDGRRLENSPDVLVFSPDGRKLAGVIAPHDVDARPALRRPLHAWADSSSALGKALHVWDAETGREIRGLPASWSGGVPCPRSGTRRASCSDCLPKNRRRPTRRFGATPPWYGARAETASPIVSFFCMQPPRSGQDAPVELTLAMQSP
jgi:dipeptidyl aminopeptidase/acylaminoacyl peptidase